MQIEILTSHLSTAQLLYKEKKYHEAMAVLTNTLDIDPRDWLARLMIGACYYQTQQGFAAQRAFRYVYDNCPDAQLRKQACFAMQSAGAAIGNGQRAAVPLEFREVTQQYHGVLSGIDAIFD